MSGSPNAVLSLLPAGQGPLDLRPQQGCVLGAEEPPAASITSGSGSDYPGLSSVKSPMANLNEEKGNGKILVRIDTMGAGPIHHPCSCLWPERRGGSCERASRLLLASRVSNSLGL